MQCDVTKEAPRFRTCNPPTPPTPTPTAQSSQTRFFWQTPPHGLEVVCVGTPQNTLFSPLFVWAFENSAIYMILGGFSYLPKFIVPRACERRRLMSSAEMSHVRDTIPFLLVFDRLLVAQVLGISWDHWPEGGRGGLCAGTYSKVRQPSEEHPLLTPLLLPPPPALLAPSEPYWRKINLTKEKSSSGHFWHTNLGVACRACK